MKGYRYAINKIVDPKLVEVDVLVGCKRCWECWRENRFMLKDGRRINSPIYDYDYCDNCKTEKDES
jgi:hypothetical protein